MHCTVDYLQININNIEYDIIDETYVDIYGSVPFTPGMRKMMLKNFNLIISINNVAVIVDENDNEIYIPVLYMDTLKVSTVEDST